LNLNELDSFRDYHYKQELQNAFKLGAKWQQERSYSEEDFKELVYNMVGALAYANNMTFNGAILDELFKKFKNK
jgi:hypothetical protein